MGLWENIYQQHTHTRQGELHKISAVLQNTLTESTEADRQSHWLAGVKPLSQKDFIGLILCFFHRDGKGKMHPCSAGLTRLDRARETEGTDGLKAGRRGKSEQLSCVTKASTIVWGSLGIPDSKCRREIILLHLWACVHAHKHGHYKKQSVTCTQCM